MVEESIDEDESSRGDYRIAEETKEWRE